MMAGVATAPVHAEEAEAVKTAADESKADASKRAAAPTKEARLSADLEAFRAEKASGVLATSDSEQVGGAYRKGGAKNKLKAPLKDKKDGEAVGVSSSSSSSSAAAPPVGQLIPGKNKVIISPADELDEDELNPWRQNFPLLFVVLTIWPAIFLVFYVLGSLDVI